MKNEFPNFVHRNKFPFYYLFQDSEIIMNKTFSEKLLSFSKSINGENIFIEILIPEEFESLIVNKLITFPNSENKSLDLFYNLSFELEKTIFSAYMFDFIIYDDTYKWELHCSLGYELGILGCYENIKYKVINIIKPYENLSLKRKLKGIEKIFNNESSRNLFISTLVRNYNMQR